MRWFFRAPIDVLVSIPMLFSLIVFLINSLIVTDRLLFMLLLSLTFFLFGCSGIPIIIRREVPNLFLRVPGTSAVFNGIIQLSIGFFASLFFLILAVSGNNK